MLIIFPPVTWEILIPFKTPHSYPYLNRTPIGGGQDKQIKDKDKGTPKTQSLEHASLHLPSEQLNSRALTLKKVADKCT